jgi:hypothetical protein
LEASVVSKNVNQFVSLTPHAPPQCIACSKTGVLCAVVSEPDYNRILREYHSVTNKYHELFVF